MTLNPGLAYKTPIVSPETFRQAEIITSAIQRNRTLGDLLWLDDSDDALRLFAGKLEALEARPIVKLLREYNAGVVRELEARLAAL